MRGDEIDPAKVQGKGAQLLRDFLVYAERGLLVSARLDAMAKAESPFEREVLAQLESRRFVVKPQVGVGPYRVDIGVLDRDLPGRFICGIECDGAAYHQSETARDRDRLRESVLRRLGWRLHRVWSTDWFKNREAQIERLVILIEGSRREGQAAAARRRSGTSPLGRGRWGRSYAGCPRPGAAEAAITCTRNGKESDVPACDSHSIGHARRFADGPRSGYCSPDPRSVWKSKDPCTSPTSSPGSRSTGTRYGSAIASSRGSGRFSPDWRHPAWSPGRGSSPTSLAVPSVRARARAPGFPPSASHRLAGPGGSACRTGDGAQTTRGAPRRHAASPGIRPDRAPDLKSGYPPRWRHLFSRV